jgi:magnesium-transporting ATPase (P-type)
MISINSRKDEMDNLEPQTPNQKSTKGYGKRPMWQWVVLYLIVAAIVYGLIYYFFFRNGGGTGY